LAAGCGKSVLVSSIIDDLIASSQSHALAYYFCDHVDKRTLDAIAILSTITRQLLEKNEIPPTIEKLITENYGDQRAPDWLGALDVLVAVTQLFPSITMILDGIDEMDEENRKTFLSAVNRLGYDRGPPLKLLISCREDITQSLRILSTTVFRVHIQPSSLALDIEDYVSYTIQSMLENGNLAIQDPALKEIIIEKLVSGAQGMYAF
jgi:NACHT domain